jgi:hypothetical protein
LKILAHLPIVTKLYKDTILTVPDGSSILQLLVSIKISINWQKVPDAFAYKTLLLLLKLKNKEYFFKNFNKTTLPGLKLYQNLCGKFVVLKI